MTKLKSLNKPAVSKAERPSRDGLPPAEGKVGTNSYFGEGEGADAFTKSRLYHDWYYRVGAGTPNDYIIAITADPRFTGVSGTGKTTMAGGLAKWYLDFSDNGFDADIQYTMDPDDILQKMYPESGPGACMIYDEAQGTPSSTGLNSKRAMKNEALDAINTIATRRKDRKTLIIVSQSLKSLNKDLFDFIDAWLLIRDDIRYIATHYQVQPDVFNLESRKTRTPGVEELSWDPLAKDDPDYEKMEEIKDKSSTGSTDNSDEVDEEDEDSGHDKATQKVIAQALRDQGLTLNEISDDERIEFSRNWVCEHTEG